MDKDKIEMKATMDSAAVAEYLTALAKGFRSGVICVEKGGVPISASVGAAQRRAAERQHTGDGNAGDTTNDEDGYECAARAGADGIRV